MNVLFISPHFPQQFFHFVTALRERGVNVLGLGDAPYDSLRPELREALSEYFFTPDLNDYDALLRATGYWTVSEVIRHSRTDPTWRYPLVQASSLLGSS